MKIAVIGAGVVGICTAYELALDGHAVTVFERHAAVAEESSFACGAHQSPSLSHPLAFPAWPPTSRWRALFSPTGITLGRGTGLADLRWLCGWTRGAQSYLERFAAAHRLANYSLARQQSLIARAAMVVEQSPGQLLLLRSERDLLAYQERLSALKAQGVSAHILTPEAARQCEPALGSQVSMHCAIHFPNDGVGNCRQFAQALKEQALALGVVFHFATPVTAIAHTPTIQVHTDRLGAQGFERVVVCAAAGATALLPALKRVALARVASYSLSAHIREPLNAPRSAVLDGHSQVSISRLGARIRVSGGAELGGTPQRQREASTRLLYQTLQTHFPGAADFSRSMPLWAGASVFSPDALPLLGASAQPGIWLNLAHGHNGWSMACGAARILADQLGGRQTEVDTQLLHPSRFKA
jgi:D-amino-acid dehydrogenase